MKRCVGLAASPPGFAYPCSKLYFLADAGGDRRGVGLRGGRAAAAVRRPPRARRGRWPGPTPRRASRWRRCTRRWPPPTRSLEFSKVGADDLAGLDVVFLALPHGESQALAPALVGRVGLLVDLSADFRLRDAGGLPDAGTGTTTSRPSCSARSSTGCPSSSAPSSPGARLVAAPGCYPTAAALALAPLVRAGVDRDDRRHRRRRQRRVGRGAQAVARHALQHRRRGLHRLRAARPPPHARDRAGVGRPGAVHAAPGPHEPGHPGHLLRPARPASSHDRRRPRRSCGDAYAGEPFVVVSETSPSTKATLGSNCAHLTARVDPRTGWVLALCALDNLVKGASGQAVQCANIALGLPEDDRAPARGGVPVSVTAPGGVRGRGTGVRDQGVGCPRPGPGGRRRAGAVPAAGVFTANLAAAAPVQVSRAHLAATAGRAAAVVLSSGNANAATGRAGRGRRRAHVRAGGRRARCRGRPRSWCARPGSSASRCPWHRSRPGSPCWSRRGLAGRDGGPARGHGHHDHRHRVQGGRRRGRRVHGGRHGQGGGHAGPEHGDHAGRAHDRRRAATPPRWPRRCAGAVETSFNRMTVDGCTSTNDTVLVLASGASGTSVARRRAGRRAGPRPAATWPA